MTKPWNPVINRSDRRSFCVSVSTLVAIVFIFKLCAVRQIDDKTFALVGSFSWLV